MTRVVSVGEASTTSPALSARMLTRAAAPPSAAPKHCAYAAAGASDASSRRQAVAVSEKQGLSSSLGGEAGGEGHSGSAAAKALPTGSTSVAAAPLPDSPLGVTVR